MMLHKTVAYPPLGHTLGLNFSGPNLIEMPLEIEHRYKVFDKAATRRILKPTKPRTFLLKQSMYKHPSQPYYIRVRNIGPQTILTIKVIDDKSEFIQEYETEVTDLKTIDRILTLLGCEKTYYVEKIREVWAFRDYEVVFDRYPALPEIMEIETKTVPKLKSLEGKLGLTPISFGIMSLYQDLYGIERIDSMDFKMKRVEPIKNKSLFRKTLASQRKQIT